MCKRFALLALTALTLAALCFVGTRIYTSEKPLGYRLRSPAVTVGDLPSAAPSPTLTKLNAATALELTAIPGVGPVLAQSIVSEREQNGPFAYPEDLSSVRGVGEARYQAILDYFSLH